jgi:F-type H+-transporting ATPase subunit alpha
MLAFFRSEHGDVLKTIRETGKFEDDTKAKVVAGLEAFAKQFA